MNVRDFDPRPAGDVVPDPFVEGTTNRWMPFDPIQAATAYHAARAWAYYQQVDAEPGNVNAAALLVTEYHVASLYYALCTSSASPKALTGFNKGMRERPETLRHNIRHILGYVGVDPRDIAPFKSRERIQRETLEKLHQDLIYHAAHEGEAVEVRGPHGWYDVAPVIMGALYPDARKGDPAHLPEIRAKLTKTTEQEPTE
ncbi:hypothetical protein HYQ19_gp075 [Arthrobacter phage DrYang]|uniref:Uncharacterized protein n=1 Tax=Arthrobacter phage DrYang TaxID=2686080 RepID=A0A6B9J9X4_9CAUD|nr:hypothetical protein HYQ19_gp075 [Arthrobacter phage DrYang]QGZ17174.1 hypothetical protein SEA_DRYANG_75 [Arthrobacter phage DrYang]